jgi:hypothetical protein
VLATRHATHILLAAVTGRGGLFPARTRGTGKYLRHVGYTASAMIFAMPGSSSTATIHKKVQLCTWMLAGPQRSILPQRFLHRERITGILKGETGQHALQTINQISLTCSSGHRGIERASCCQQKTPNLLINLYLEAPPRKQYKSACNKLRIQDTSSAVYTH